MPQHPSTPGPAPDLRRRAWARVPAAAWLAGLLGPAAGLIGCAAPPAAPPPPPVPWADALFAAPSPPVPGPEAVRGMSAAMQAYLRDHLPQGVALGLAQGPALQQRLVNALYSRGELQLDYDARRTRTASEAFAERRGNCLSLVLMTAAFAEALGLAVQFNEADVLTPWERQADLVLRSGHVNLSLVSDPVTRGGYQAGLTLMVDFLPGQDLKRLRTWPISPARVLAMYYNNRAAEALAEGQVHSAYWFARASLQQDAGFDDGRNTLGVVYQRAGLREQAGDLFAQVLARQPTHLGALSNLALWHEQGGQGAEASALRARRSRLEALAGGPPLSAGPRPSAKPAPPLKPVPPA